ncbi:MAG: exosortase-associated EpsI family protein, partial [bacterium]
MTKIAAALIFLIMNGYVYWYLGSAEIIPDRALFAQFPNELESWGCMGREEIDEKTINNLMVTDYISCNFYRAEPNSAVHLYVGYHERQT